MAQAERLFDSRLKSMTKLISAANNGPIGSRLEPSLQTPSTFFQIWDHHNKLIARSSNAPTTSLSVLASGFHDVNYKSYRWRNFIFHDEARQHWVVSAERSDIRYTLAEQVVLQSIIPIILAIPLSALIIWWVVSLGLRPLQALSEQLKLKQADDLSPIILEQTPKEIAQLTQTTNALFKRLDDAFQREQRFSADAAHELRTPISVLKVQLHNLQTVTEKDNEALNRLRQGIERMEHLIEQILALYRTSPEQAMANFSTIDLYKLAQNKIANDYAQFEEKQQTIELIGEPSTVEGDPFALETLLQNLLSNASKYSPNEGQILVSIKRLNSEIEFVIEDSGRGIPESQYKRVFERFFRLLDEPLHSETIGCGLGLAIVNHIVDLHHATIKLSHSKFENGLKCTITFPIKRVT
jgi:two-component system sensor histidine kinase QseC